MISKTLRLLSLLDIMNELGMKDLSAMFLVLHAVIFAITGMKDERGGAVQASESELKWILRPVKMLKEECSKYGLTQTLGQIENVSYLESDLSYPIVDRSYGILFAVLSNLNLTLMKELDSHKFLWVKSEYAALVDQEQVFGEDVYEGFPSARGDLKEAGNCIAAECNTAAVFHLMRAVEWGMRAFCADVGFKRVCIDRKKNKFLPISYSQWDKILSQLPDKIDKKIERIKNRNRKQIAQEFYHPVRQDIRGFKDAYRNHIMHTRRDYSHEEAWVILIHVKNFLVRLSSQVSESKIYKL
jgi:hypothetical protein